MADAIFEKLASCGVVPVIAIDRADDAVPLADALAAGGVSAVEITFRTEAAAESIARIAQERPDMLIGAGTVITPDQARAAHDAGARYALAPGCSEPVIDAAAEIGLPFIPGVCTPSDVERALALNCRLLKFFPAGAMGGLDTLNAMAGPYKHAGVRFVPTGGVNPDNAADYLRNPIVAAVGGTWIAKTGDIADGRWDAITERARDAMRIVGLARNEADA